MLTGTNTVATPVALTSFIRLGSQLYHLLNPQTSHWETYFGEIRGFLQSLTVCDLPDTHHAALPLGNITTIYYDSRTGTISPAGVTYFRAFLESVVQTLYAEAGRKELAAIKSGAVSQQLQQLPSKLTLNVVQQHLLNETMTCLKAEAWRAEMVMGWGLAYDFIRQWVFDNHLNRFNEELAKNLDKNGKPVFSEITTYEDFFTGHPGEMKVIETCGAANIISGRVRDDLRQHLRKRNDYAHRSFTTSSSEESNAYIKELIDIITRKPFV